MSLRPFVIANRGQKVAKKAEMDDLLALMARLRDPQGGCPWDLEQNFSTIAPYTLEEACEVLDAIVRKDYDNLREELGDLLFQVVFHARMAEELNLFAFKDVVAGLVDKMIRRHPHVFAEPAEVSGETAGKETGKETGGNAGEKQPLTGAQVKARWQAIKAQEKAEKKKSCPQEKVVSALPDGLSAHWPALKKAEKIQQAAARVGFDWDHPDGAEEKVLEELTEIRQARAEAASFAAIEDEVGDLLFASVNYARHLGVDCELALQKATFKFASRFRQMEAAMASAGQDFADLSLEAMEAYWQQAKENLKSRQEPPQ